MNILLAQWIAIMLAAGAVLPPAATEPWWAPHVQVWVSPVQEAEADLDLPLTLRDDPDNPESPGAAWKIWDTREV